MKDSLVPSFVAACAFVAALAIACAIAPAAEPSQVYSLPTVREFRIVRSVLVSRVCQCGPTCKCTPADSCGCLSAAGTLALGEDRVGPAAFFVQHSPRYICDGNSCRFVGDKSRPVAAPARTVADAPRGSCAASSAPVRTVFKRIFRRQ